ncbi:MAG: RdgB/HAM1 family non-canonical purine NTP pyrophosphatase [Chthoniobacterales bacterium]
MIRLLVATRNAHKTREYRELLGAEFKIDDLSQLPDLGSVDESGASFAENAKLKALSISAKLSGLVMADDSGLEVEALGGAPGIRSARYAGERATDEENIAQLLEQLDPVGEQARQARFRCVIVLAQTGKTLGIFQGTVDGTITSSPRGCGGFGYDPVFVPHEYRETFAELSAEVKNTISHRARAAAALKRHFRASGQMTTVRRPQP